MKRFLNIALTVAAVFVTQQAFACAACAGGKTDTEMTRGMNAGIFFLLGVVAIVLGGAASFGIYLVRKAARTQLEAAEPVAQPTI